MLFDYFSIRREDVFNYTAVKSFRRDCCEIYISHAKKKITYNTQFGKNNISIVIGKRYSQTTIIYYTHGPDCA